MPNSIEEALEPYMYIRIVCERTFTKNGREYGCVTDDKLGPFLEKEFVNLAKHKEYLAERLQRDGWKIIDGKQHCPDCVHVVENGPPEDEEE